MENEKGVRLNKYLADAGKCSRREADDFITAGLVTVNGQIVTQLGTKVLPTDEVKFNDSRVQGEKKVYLVLNKPKGYVTSLDDPHAGKTVMDLVEGACTERIYPVGRLDKNSLGLLLFTNDGDLTKQLTHPSYKKKKIYQVTLDKPLTRADMDRIAEGVTRAAANEALGEDAASVPFGVGVIHTGLDLDPNKAPVAPAKLLRAGFDYWALGHVHKRLIYTEDNPRLAFSGCIQGRDIKETGPRGVNLVTLEEGRRNVVEFIPTASVVWQRMKVDISECVTVPDVSDLVTRELFRVNGKAHCGEMCTRIVLCGTTPLHEVLKRPGLIDDLRNQINDSHPEFFCDALIDKTRRPFDREAARREGMFPAVFLGVAESMREDEAGEAAFLQDEFLKSNVALPSALVQSIPTLAEEAQDLVIDLLCGGDDQ